MKDFSTKNIIKQVVCWILLLQIINISISPPEFNYHNSSFTSKVGMVDEIESIYELIAQGIFNEDVPESNNDEIDSSSPAIELYFFNRYFSNVITIKYPLEHFTQSFNSFPVVHQQPVSPPPKSIS